ncbi:MAG: LuxR C-terminal-related transcriptional regulator [Alphaproteobacteria bacterium]
MRRSCSASCAPSTRAVRRLGVAGGQAHRRDRARTGAAGGAKTRSRRARRRSGLIGKGLSNKEIGKALDLKEKTVKHYVTNVLQKLQVQRASKPRCMRAIGPAAAERPAVRRGQTSSSPRLALRRALRDGAKPG